MAKKWISKISEQKMGFEDIPICRPNFIFFDFDGLKPNSAYWVYFNGIEVTKYTNTSYTMEDWHSAGKNSKLRSPGESYVKSNAFPTKLGGPTGTPLYSDATGSLEGVFYLQSNEDLSFPVGKLELAVLDISVYDITKSLSAARAMYTADGQYKNYKLVDNGYYKTYSSNNKDPNKSASQILLETSGPTLDLPGNWLERTLGYGVGGDYMASTGDYKGYTDAERKSDSKGTGANSNTGDGCFLTTAIVDRRGEADDGPTLSILRDFRDTYMKDMLEDIKEYYDVAPKIVAAIPKDHSRWAWIENEIDGCVSHIKNKKLEEAYSKYENMVSTLKSEWVN
jgi:hypothetical protein